VRTAHDRCPESMRNQCGSNTLLTDRMPRIPPFKWRSVPAQALALAPAAPVVASPAPVQSQHWCQQQSPLCRPRQRLLPSPYQLLCALLLPRRLCALPVLHPHLRLCPARPHMQAEWCQVKTVSDQTGVGSNWCRVKMA
jgi:hypothetical protein